MAAPATTQVDPKTPAPSTQPRPAKPPTTQKRPIKPLPAKTTPKKKGSASVLVKKTDIHRANSCSTAKTAPPGQPQSKIPSTNTVAVPGASHNTSQPVSTASGTGGIVPNSGPPQTAKPTTVTGKRKREETRAAHNQRSQCSGCYRYFAKKNLAIPSCDDAYCPKCLEKMLQKVLTNESQYPPRCCGRIVPVATAKLSKEFRARFLEKEAEYRIPVDKRVYCFVPKCSTLIQLANIKESLARCQACKSSTCTRCKKQAHLGQCTTDEGDNKILQLATEQGWQQCTRCKRVIERIARCNLMSRFLLSDEPLTVDEANVNIL